MRRRLIAVAIATALLAGGVLASGGPPAGADDPPRAPSFAAGVVRLDGAQEVPTAGDPDGRGTFAYIAGHGRLCYVLTARNIEPATLAHIHEGAVGVPGDIVVGLVPPTRGFSADCVRAQPGSTDVMAMTPEELAQIIADPAGFYVNVHNGPFAAGAIRGQLR